MTNRPVYYIARVVPAYRTPILERLNARIDGRLVVCHGEPPGSSSLSTMTDEAQTSYRQVPLKNYWIGGGALHAHDVTRPFRALGRPAVILAEESPRSLSLLPLLIGARVFGVPIVLWGHFSSNARAVAERNLAQQYRFRMARMADACVCYTTEICRMLAHEVPEERLFTAPNTLDIDTLMARRKELAKEGEEAVRNRLGLPTDRPIIAFVGRVDAAKGVQRLAGILSRIQKEPALVVVGDGPEKEALRRTAADHLSFVHFCGALSPEAAAPYLFASDVVLLPGPVGLSVNHAFAMGRAVVTERSPGPERYHGPEATYLREGFNAVFAPYGDDYALASAVEKAIADRERLSANALQYAKAHLRPGGMVDGLVMAIRHAEREARAE